jgi:hypothetical protein
MNEFYFTYGGIFEPTAEWWTKIAKAYPKSWDWFRHRQYQSLYPDRIQDDITVHHQYNMENDDSSIQELPYFFDCAGIYACIIPRFIDNKVKFQGEILINNRVRFSSGFKQLRIEVELIVYEYSFSYLEQSITNESIKPSILHPYAHLHTENIHKNKT